MPTRNISLPPEQRQREDALKLKVLRAQVSAGFDELDRGDFIELDGDDLARQLIALTVPRRKHT